jgi:hypothetical protein
VIMTTCQAHGAAGFTNLLVTKEDGAIVLNPTSRTAAYYGLITRPRQHYTMSSESGSVSWHPRSMADGDEVTFALPAAHRPRMLAAS